MLAETTAEEIHLRARKNATVIEQEAILRRRPSLRIPRLSWRKVKVQFLDLLRQYDSLPRTV